MPAKRRSSRVQSRNELADQEGALAPIAEAGFGAADAGIGLQRDAAEKVQYDCAAALAEGIPEDVSAQAGGGADQDHQRQVHAALSGESSGGEQQRRRRNGQATLLQQYPAEEQGIAVVNHELERVAHSLQRDNGTVSVDALAARKFRLGQYIVDAGAAADEWLEQI